MPRWRRRRDGLSFQHHAEVAPLAEAEQDLWLDRAERHHWSRNRLRREIAARRGTMRAAKLAGVVRIELPVDRAARWREAADRSAQDLEAWVAHAVDAAAEALLDGPLAPAGVPRPRLELAPLRREGR